MSTNLNETPTATGAAAERAFKVTPKQFATGALILALGFGLVLLWFARQMSIKDSAIVTSSNWPVVIWAGLCMLACASLGAMSLFGASGGALSAEERTRFRLLTLGGVLGFFTSVLGLLLPFTAYATVFTGGLKVWRENPAALLWTGGALFGGLTVMFASMQLARGLERTNPNLRRLLYGFNAVLGSLLLIAFLGLLNVLAYTRVGPFKFFKQTFDWTSGGIYTLSEQSRNTLADLKQPVKVYVIMNQEDRATDQVETLLKNCEAVSPELSWTSWSRDRNLAELKELLQKYPVSEPYGLLVLYGKDPQIAWDFIKYDDIVGTPTMNMRNPSPEKFTFKGENALMKTITYLREGKARSVIYFTQGNGELDFNDKSAGGRAGNRTETGLGTLIERIGKSNYDVKELKLGAGGEAKVPSDAEVVVVARPGGNGVPMDDAAVQALRDYVHGSASGKKGKLMVLLDVVTLPNGSMVKSGLEGLLQEYGVRAGDDRVLALQPFRQPTDLLVTVNSRSTNPVAQAFLGSGRPPTFLFDTARTVESSGPDTGGSGPYNTEVLIQTIPDLYCFSLKDMTASPLKLATDLRKPENREKLREMISVKPLPLAVTVAETKGPAQPMPPGHPPMNKDSVPRMIVFGDASWVNNQNLTDSRFSNLELFTNCLTWLRERPDIGLSIPDVERQEYLLSLPEEGSGLRLQLLPPVLMMLLVIGLAGGIWVVRRR